MTAGRGVAHAEESTARNATVHGVQLWVALPEATREGPPAFEHHAELPRHGIGPFTATVLVGELGDARSPARADTPLVGAEVVTGGGRADVPLDPAFEHALLVLEGAVDVEGRALAPGTLAYLGTGRDGVALAAAGPTRALLVGGAPFGEAVLMWWNFVGRTRADIDGAYADWEAGAARFGEVASALGRIPAPAPRWSGGGRATGGA
jgi:redox-sensitive bicupin YhaK (pirin superfamily)